MQRKAYVSGVAALLAALLAGCTSGSDDGATTDSSNPGDTTTATTSAEPGRYRTLPEPCSAVGHETLDSLLPGIRQLTDKEQRDKAYAGEATQTYDTDRKVGCRWKVDSADTSDRLLVDFERVVSYDNAVSDDSEAESVFATRQEAAHLPEPTTTSPETPATPEAPASATPSTSGADSPSSSTASPSSSPSLSPTPTDDIQPRVLDDLGDEAFLDDELSSAGSTAPQRTVTVAFRTSNVIVTIRYEEQPTTVGVVPDSKEMQDGARNLASQLADSLSG
ncbi:DUF3558 domain-containing protein [Streptomyces sp. TRM68367]|uniref:DUF3558 domain-containing protein n=1 Tax=Streptomyces sp. TRM68367 TaxID=2758415 RepID=UPI00165B0825|nr:DUF3558 domain-containing protein [Streptomyces sp. TRM68367]MBC9727852.1 DUF3558 domain-containing protein [Streptomyces sp. TRM68367]